MKNRDIAQIFGNMALLLEMKGENIFKIKAYQRAAENILALSEDIEAIKNENRLATIPGIGEALQNKIIEFIDTGRVAAYENLKKEIPESILEIVQIPTVGPRKAKLFYDHLKIKSINELEQAAQSGRLLGLPGIQEKAVENILKGIKLVREGQERMDIATAVYVADGFVNALKALPDVKKIFVAGSLRRMKETVRDIDILIDSPKPEKVMDVFVNLPQVKTVNAKGETKSSVLTKDNIQIDLRVVAPKSFGAALLYFTGSKNFNVKLRQIAIKKNMKVNEYGIFSVRGERERFLCGDTERNVLKRLGLGYIPPELREDIGEAELFSPAFGGGKKAPKLVELTDIKGDLQVHSTWSDGKNTIAKIAQTAQTRGYEYIAITDHSARLKVAGGMSVEDLKRKRKEIENLNGRLKGFRVLYGTEVEIDSQGNLDYNDDTLSEFDIVVAAIHSGFEQDSKQLTRRIVNACRNKYVHVIAHPTGVHLGKREPCDIDLKEICKVARDTNTFLEINAFPVRLDLNSSNVYFARSQGVRFVISTDAHEAEHLDFMKFGVGIARCGWLEKKDVLNTLSLTKMLKTISKK